MNALQTVVSRSVDLTANPAVVTVGMVRAGVRQNIIPDSAELLGTVRTFDPEQRLAILKRMAEIAGGADRKVRSVRTPFS